MNIQYKALDILMIPKLATAYKEFYEADSKSQMSEVHQQNLLSFIISNYANPNFLFLIACSGKKIAGFATVQPVPAIDAIKTVSVDSIYVVPEYRHQDIAETMVKMMFGWIEQKGIDRCFITEKIDGGIWSRKKHIGLNPYRTLLIWEAKNDTPKP